MESQESKQSLYNRGYSTRGKEKTKEEQKRSKRRVCVCVCVRVRVCKRETRKVLAKHQPRKKRVNREREGRALLIVLSDKVGPFFHFRFSFLFYFESARCFCMNDDAQPSQDGVDVIRMVPVRSR